MERGCRITTVDPIIIKDKRVLLQKRSFGLFKGFWVLPGGKVEIGEDVQEACIREAMEETGIEVKILKMLGVYSGKDRDPEKHAVSIAFLCKPMRGEPRASKEATEMGFFDLKKLPEKIGFDHRDIIKDAKKELGL